MHAAIGSGSGTAVSFSFGVETPWSTAGVGGFPNPTAPAGDSQTLRDPAGRPGAGPDRHDAPTTTPPPATSSPATGPGPGRYGALIYSPQGQLVWVDQPARGSAAEDVNVQTYHGQQDLTFWQGRVLSLGYGAGRGRRHELAYQTVAMVHGGNGLARRPARVPDRLRRRGLRDGLQPDPLRSGLGRRAPQRRDPGRGRARRRHADRPRALGMARPRPRRCPRVGDSPPASRAWDWFHINSIDVEPGGNVLDLGPQHVGRLPDPGGHAARSCGGSAGSRARSRWARARRPTGSTTGASSPTANVTFFDDGSDPPEEAQSRGGDDRARHDRTTPRGWSRPSRTRARPCWPPARATCRRCPTATPSSATAACPTSASTRTDGSLLFDAHLPLDQVLLPRLPPSVERAAGGARRPSLANLNNTGLETIVRMSWNGATGVASWRVLAGREPGLAAPRRPRCPPPASRARRSCRRSSCRHGGRRGARRSGRCRRSTPSRQRASGSSHRRVHDQ